MRRISILVLLIGCSSDESPVEKCDDLIDVTCDRAVECLPNSGTHTMCVQEVQQSIPCGTAKSVSGSYDRCLSELTADSCPVLFPADPQSGQPTLKLPADCMSVILTREVPPSSTASQFESVSLATDVK